MGDRVPEGHHRACQGVHTLEGSPGETHHVRHAVQIQGLHDSGRDARGGGLLRQHAELQWTVGHPGFGPPGLHERHRTLQPPDPGGPDIQNVPDRALATFRGQQEVHILPDRPGCQRVVGPLRNRRRMDPQRRICELLPQPDLARTPGGTQGQGGGVQDIPRGHGPIDAHDGALRIRSNLQRRPLLQRRCYSRERRGRGDRQERLPPQILQEDRGGGQDGGGLHPGDGERHGGGGGQIGEAPQIPVPVQGRQVLRHRPQDHAWRLRDLRGRLGCGALPHLRRLLHQGYQGGDPRAAHGRVPGVPAPTGPNPISRASG